MPADEIGRNISTQKGRSFSWVLVCIVCILETFVTAQHAAAVGTVPDIFTEVPRRKDEGGLFVIPEIMVTMKAWILGGALDKELIRLERWEHVYGTVGYVAGFVKRDGDDGGKLKMCACTKYTNILSEGLKSEMDKRRQESFDKITDFNDLDLDMRIESECDAAGTYKGCVDIAFGITPDSCNFCSAFIKEETSRVLPLEFSKQTYFDPGIRMMGVPSSSASQDVYTGVYGMYWERIRGETHKLCQGSIKDMVYGTTECVLEEKKKSSEPHGYTVYRSNEDTICMHGKYDNRTSLDCVPAPTLQRPFVEKNKGGGNGLRLKFPDCKDREGKDTKYCDLTVNLGEKDDSVGFSVVKPKLDNQYEFKRVQKCLSGAQDGGSCYYEYEDDPNGNVTCVTNLKHAQRRYYIKRDGRYHWVSEMPKVLTAKAYDPTLKRYIQCPDSKSIDLSKISQVRIDEMVIKGNSYQLLRNNPGTLCDGNVLYTYSNYRSLEYPGNCRQEDKENAHKEGFCRTKYVSLDNYEPFFLKEGESHAQGSIVQLNDMMQGLCVSNFPQHEYKYVPEKDHGDIGVSRNIFSLAKDNASCDFLKIEMWGGGESGVLAADKGAGRPGTYVMGILKVAGNEGKRLLINVGQGGVVNHVDQGSVRVAGKNTMVSLCSDYGGKSCSVRLVAKGGGASDISASGYENLVHYRLSEGKSKGAPDEVFIPYQGDNDVLEGAMYAEKAGCVRSGSASANSLEVVAPSAYHGTGGCADRLKGIIQSGADGAVRLTCEKWSGPKGNVKEWEAALCEAEIMSHFEKLKEYSSAKKLSGNSVDFFANMATEKFCAASGAFPGFLSEVESVHSYISGKSSIKDLHLGSKKNIRGWIDSRVDSLGKALDAEKAILDIYEKNFAKQKKSAQGNTKDVFVGSFREILRTLVGTYASVKDIVRYAEVLERYARKYGSKLSGMFEVLTEEDVARAVSENPEFVEFLKELVSVLGKSSVTFDDESEFESWIDSYRKRMKKILSEDEEIVHKYMDAVSLGGSGAKRTAKVVEQVINDITSELKDVFKGEVKLEFPTADLKKTMENLKRYADSKKLSSREVFARLARGAFLKDVLRSQGFLSAVESINNTISVNGDIEVKNKDEKDALVENKMALLKNALDRESKVVLGYKKVHGNAAISDDQAKQDMLHAFQEMLDSKVVENIADYEAVLEMLKSIEKRGQLDLGILGINGAVLTIVAHVDVAKAAVKSKAVLKVFKDIASVRSGSNVFNGKKYSKKAFQEYIRDMPHSEELANFIRDSIRQITQKQFEDAMMEFVEKTVTTKSEQPVPDYDIKQAVQEIKNLVSNDGKTLALVNHIFNSKAVPIMEQNACLVSALYAIANVHTMLLNLSNVEYLEFMNDQEKRSVRNVIAGEFVECLYANRDISRNLKAAIGPVTQYGCSDVEDCIGSIADNLVDRITKIPGAPDLKVGIADKVRDMFEYVGRGREDIQDSTSRDVLHAITKDRAWECYSVNHTVVYTMTRLIRAVTSPQVPYYCGEYAGWKMKLHSAVSEAIEQDPKCIDAFAEGFLYAMGGDHEDFVARARDPYSKWIKERIRPELGEVYSAKAMRSEDCGNGDVLSKRIKSVADLLRDRTPEFAAMFDIMSSHERFLRIAKDSGFQMLIKDLEEILQRGDEHLKEKIRATIEHLHENEQMREVMQAYHGLYLDNIDEITKLSFVRSIFHDKNSQTHVEYALNGTKYGWGYASTRILFHVILSLVQ